MYDHRYGDCMKKKLTELKSNLVRSPNGDRVKNVLKNWMVSNTKSGEEITQLETINLKMGELKIKNLKNWCLVKNIMPDCWWFYDNCYHLMHTHLVVYGIYGVRSLIFLTAEPEL